MGSEREEFDARYIPEPNSGCWLWLGMYQTGKEYGLFCFRRETRKAHRASWEINHGKIPHEMHVLHHCDTPACVNPNHLFIGSHADNMADRGKKNRSRGPLGEAAPAAKLTEDDVKQIRSSLKSTKTLALIYGVNKSTIERILNRTTWNHVD